MKKPKVSVIVPIYNVEPYLKKCIDSLLAQTLKDIEIILLDDGSPDNCPQICDEYAKLDSRIKVVHKANGGYGHTCNTGIAMANGEYIGIVESDDWVSEDMYEKLYIRANSTNSDITKGAYYSVINTEKDIKSVTHWVKKISKKLDIFSLKDCADFIKYHTSIWSAIYKTSWIKENNIKFVEDIRPYEDLPFIATVYSKANKITIMPDPVYFYRTDAATSSMNAVRKTILNYITQRERNRAIYLENGFFNGELLENYWHITYLSTKRFFNLPKNIYRKEFYKGMQRLYLNATNDNCEFKNFDKKGKKDFQNIIKWNYETYMLITNLLVIMRKIFSVSNISKRHKQITFLCIKFKLKRKNNKETK